MKKDECIKLLKKYMDILKNEYGITSLSLFGSTARGEQKEGIIEAVAKRLELPLEQVMINIEHFGNTSAATIPLALWENESKLKKGDNIILTAFGAGFVHGASYYKWAYNGAER